MAAAEPGIGKQWIPLQRQLVPTTKDAAETYGRNVRRRQKEAIQNALSKGYLITLDRDVILEQWCDGSSNEGLESVLRVSLPNSRVQAIDDMALLSCARLRICNLSNCFVNDMAAFYGCVNLLTLDLSNNQIEHVPQGDFWSSLSSLRVLYLHGNSVSSRSCLQQLNHCPHLHILTLHSTPLSLVKNYRHHVVNGIMSLQALDEHVVSDEEIIENLRLKGSFQTFSPQLKLHLYTSHCKGTDFATELRDVYRLLLAVDFTLAHYSPVLIVQRWIRGWLTRRALAKSTNARIKSLISKCKFTGKSKSHTTARPSAKNATRMWSVGQAAITQDSPHTPPPHAPPVKSSRHSISAQVPLPSHTQSAALTPSPKSFSDPNCKATLNVPLPIPPPNSPAFQSPRTHKRAPHFSTSSQWTANESYTSAAVDPDLQQSLLQQTLYGHGDPSEAAAVDFEKSPSSDRQRAMKKGRHVVRKEVTHKEKGERESEGVDAMTVSGQKTEVLEENNWIEKMACTKQEDGRRLRKEEEQIMKSVAKTREPPPKHLRRVDPPTTIHGAPRLSKEALAFSRVFKSMHLSTLKAVDRIHEVDRLNETWSRKATHVTQMKKERENRQRKIQDIRKKTRETIEEWRIMEENKITRLREKNAKIESRNLMNRSIRQNTVRDSRKRNAMEQSFATEFSHQAGNVGREILKDDCEVAREEKRQEIKKQVQELTEATRERREEARTEREIRDTQLVWEGVLAKKELDGKMMQAAVQRTAEGKRRVERAVNRREAAKASVARSREADMINSSRSSTLHGTLPPLKLDLRSKHELAMACHEALQEATMEGTFSTSSPFRLRRFTHEANRSWQRGTMALTKQERHGTVQISSPKSHPPAPYFPAINNSATPIHRGLRPGCILRSLVSTPFQSEVTEPSPVATPSTESCHCTTHPHTLSVA